MSSETCVRKVVKTAAQGMSFTPEMMKMAADMMKNMSPEDMQRMSAMASGGMPQPGAGDPRPLQNISHAASVGCSTIGAREAAVLAALSCLCPRPVM